MPIPEKESFTLREIADLWECGIDKVEAYVYDHKVLRLALSTRDVDEVKEMGRRWTLMINAVGREELDELDAMVFRHELQSEHDDHEFLRHEGGVAWSSDPPEFIYLDFEDGNVEMGDHSYSTRNIRVPRDGAIRFDRFEDFKGRKIEICRADSWENKIVTSQ